MMNNERKMGAILSYVSIFINNIIILIYLPFMLKMMGQTEYGLFSLSSSIIGYLTILDFGFGNGLIVFSAKLKAQKKEKELEKLYGMFWLIFIVIGIFALVLGFILYFNVDNIFNATMLPEEIKKIKIMMLILIFNIAISFPFSIYSSIISSNEKFIFQRVLMIVKNILNPIIMTPLLILGFKSIGMTVVLTLLNIFVISLNYYYCRFKLNIRVKYKGFDEKIFKKVFSYSFFIFLIIVVDKINWSVDQIILGATSGVIAVSIYALASQFNSFFLQLSTAITGVLLPKISQMVSNKSSDDELTKELIKVGRIQFYVIYLAVTGFILFGLYFIKMWAGNDYSESYYVALILILPLSLDLIQSLALSITQAKGMHKFRAIFYILMAIVNVLISIPLSKKYGAIGAAIGTGITIFLGPVLVMNVYYYKKVKINIFKFWKEISKLLIPACFLTITFSFIIKNLNINIVTFCLSIMLYISAYFILVYKLLLNEYEKKVTKYFLKKVNIWEK